MIPQLHLGFSPNGTVVKEPYHNKGPTPGEEGQEEECGDFSSLGFNRYHRLSHIYGYLDHLASEHPEDVFVETIGTTSEGRDIKVVKICKGGCGRRC